MHVNYSVFFFSFYSHVRTRLTQCKALVRPGSQILGAVHRHATTLLLPFDLVLAEPVELSALRVDGDATGVRVDKVPVRVMPAAAGHDVLCVHDSSTGREEQG